MFFPTGILGMDNNDFNDRYPSKKPVTQVTGNPRKIHELPRLSSRKAQTSEIFQSANMDRQRTLSSFFPERNSIQHRRRVDVAAFLQRPHEFLSGSQPCAGDDTGVRRCFCRGFFGNRWAEDLECSPAESAVVGYGEHASPGRFVALSGVFSGTGDGRRNLPVSEIVRKRFRLT